MVLEITIDSTTESYVEWSNGMIDTEWYSMVFSGIPLALFVRVVGSM